jgi:two-component system sensor histidine kinase YesM
VFEQDDRLYIVRNLVDNSYRPWGVLVHRLNKEYCFEPLLSFFDGISAWITLDGQTVIRQGEDTIWEGVPELQISSEAQFEKKNGAAYIHQKSKGSDFELRTSWIDSRTISKRTCTSNESCRW